MSAEDSGRPRWSGLGLGFTSQICADLSAMTWSTTKADFCTILLNFAIMSGKTYWFIWFVFVLQFLETICFVRERERDRVKRVRSWNSGASSYFKLLTSKQIWASVNAQIYTLSSLWRQLTQLCLWRDFDQWNKCKFVPMSLSDYTRLSIRDTKQLEAYLHSLQNPPLFPFPSTNPKSVNATNGNIACAINYH